MDSITLIKNSQFLTCKCCHDFKQVQDVELVHLLERTQQSKQCLSNAFCNNSKISVPNLQMLPLF